MAVSKENENLHIDADLGSTGVWALILAEVDPYDQSRYVVGAAEHADLTEAIRQLTVIDPDVDADLALEAVRDSLPEGQEARGRVLILVSALLSVVADLDPRHLSYANRQISEVIDRLKD